MTRSDVAPHNITPAPDLRECGAPPAFWTRRRRDPPDAAGGVTADQAAGGGSRAAAVRARRTARAADDRGPRGRALQPRGHAAAARGRRVAERPQGGRRRRAPHRGRQHGEILRAQAPRRVPAPQPAGQGAALRRQSRGRRARPCREPDRSRVDGAATPGHRHHRRGLCPAPLGDHRRAGSPPREQAARPVGPARRRYVHHPRARIGNPKLDRARVRAARIPSGRDDRNELQRDDQAGGDGGHGRELPVAAHGRARGRDRTHRGPQGRRHTGDARLARRPSREEAALARGARVQGVPARRRRGPARQGAGVSRGPATMIKERFCAAVSRPGMRLAKRRSGAATLPARWSEPVTMQNPKRWIGLALALLAGMASAHAQTLQKVVFSTDWLAEAEHGGYYQAQAEGTYRKYGLDVTIRMGGPQVNGLQLLAAGETDIAMADALQVVSAVEQDVPLVAIAATFQKNPTVIIAHPGVRRLEDLKGKPIAIGAASNTTFWPWLRQQFGFTDAQKRPYGFSVQPFLAEPALSQQGFVTSEPYSIEQGGIQPVVFLLADRGYPPYSETLVVTRSTLARKRDVLERFIRASAEGWRSYLAHPAPGNALIRKANPEMSDDLLAYGLRKLNEYGIVVNSDARKFGLLTMTDARWQATFGFLHSAGLAKPGVDYARAYTLDLVKTVR